MTSSTVFSVNLATIYEKKHQPNISVGDVWRSAFQTSPAAYPVRYPDRLSGPDEHSASNPYNLLNFSGYNEYFYNNAQSVASLSQDFSKIITPGLTANIKYSFDAINQNNTTMNFSPQTWMSTGVDKNGNPTFPDSPTRPGKRDFDYGSGSGGERDTYLEASVNYNRLFNKVHRVGALILFNQKERNVVNASTEIAALPYRNQGLAGRLTYGFKERYFLELNLGYNGSENFSPGKRFGLFPAIAGGWLISEENFWKKLKQSIDVFKIRASYGSVGSDQIGGSRRFIYEATIDEGAEGYEWNPSNFYPGIALGDPANPAVSWEKSKKFDAGVDLGFLNSTISVQADYFSENRSGIFLQRGTIPGFAGISSTPWVNIGSMKNQGFDASFQVNKKVGEVMLTGRGNFTYAHNQILNNDEPDHVNSPYRNSKGQIFNQFFGYQAIGFFHDQKEIDNSPSQFGVKTLHPGDIKYKDINGDGVIDENDMIPAGYATGGYAMPEINYGFGLSAQWKDFDLSFFFEGIARASINIVGNDFYPFGNSDMTNTSIDLDIWKNRWTPENKDNALYPRMGSSDNPNNNSARFPSTLWLRDRSFLRLKTAEIGYSMPKKLLEKSFLKSVRFYVSGLNLLTFSKFKLWDPELGSGQGSEYPPNKTFTLGVQVNI